MENKKVLFAVDGNSLINREFYGMPLLTNKDGLHTNAVFGLINRLLKYRELLDPELSLVAFDLPVPTFRHVAFEGYKASRKGMPEELAEQLPYARKACSVLGFDIFTREGYEADDILGTVSRLAEEKEYRVYLMTGDRDSFQLVSDNVTVLYLSNNAVIEYTPEKIREAYQIEPIKLIEIKALMGDSSDEIPGVKGIGEKTAIRFISENGTLDNLYKNLDEGRLNLTQSVISKLTEGREMAYLSRRLAEICRNVPGVDALFNGTKRETDRAGLYEMCKALEFNSIIKKYNLSGNEGQKTSGITGNTDDPQIYEAVYSDIHIAELYDKFAKGSKLAVSISQETSEIYVCAEIGCFHSVISQIAELLPLFDGRYKLLLADVKSVYKTFLNESKIAAKTAFFFDFSLAGYVLNPGDSKTSVQELALRYLEVSYNAGDKGRECSLFFSLYEKLSEKMNELKLLTLYYDMELPLALLLAEIECKGFLLDKAGIDCYGFELDRISADLSGEIYDLSGMPFNINSPKQLGEILFDTLKLPVIKKNKTGYSTDADVMEKLQKLHPIVGKILEYRAVTKLKSTFCDGLSKLVSEENPRLHTSFNQTVTATGRLSSTEPNLQNIPVRTKLGREIRKYFIAKEGYVLIDADYSQIELRILAHISGDATLIDAYRDGRDIHRLTASQVFGVPENMVTGEMRSNAKAVNFGIVYGISDFSLSEDLGIPVYEAKKYIDSYFATYPGVKRYMDEIVETAKLDGYVSTLFGRIRYIPELSAKNKNIASFGERVARNTPIQGTAADIIKLAMIECDKRLKDKYPESALILQVHDELLIEAKIADADAIKVLLKEAMESVYPELKAPLVAEVSEGRSWYDAKG